MTGDIIKKLKNLREIKPGAEWKATTRDFLLTKIKEEKNSKELFPVQKQSWAAEVSQLFFSKEFFKLTLKPAVSFASIVALVLGSGFSVSASQMALPGDTLYSLKIASEKVQVAFTFKEESQAKIHVELAGKRLNEVKRIKENSGTDKNQKINIAIDKFQEEIRTVKTQLDNLHNSQEPNEIMEVAKIIDSKTNEYRKVLRTATGENGVSEEVARKISDGLALAEQTGDNALTVIAEKQDKDSQNDLIERIGKKAEEIEGKAFQVEENLGILNNNNVEIPDADNARTILWEKAAKSLNDAKMILAEAKEMLKNENVNDALDRVMESKGFVRQAEEIALEIGNDVQVVVIEAPADTETEEQILEENPMAEVAENTASQEKIAPVAVRKINPPIIKEEPKEIDESELKVGIDLKQLTIGD